MRLAILASGNGTNAQAIVECVFAGKVNAEVAVIVTNRPEAGVIQRGHKLGIPVEILPSKGIRDRELYDSSLLAILQPYQVDTIALSGWMRILSHVLLDAYPNRIVNLHPAILPSFRGGTGIEDAYNYGVRITGCTVHLVSPELDAGPIIIQAAVPVCDSLEQLEQRIHRMEHLIFPQALQWMAQNRITCKENRLTVAPPYADTPVTSIVEGCLISPALEIQNG